MNTEHLEAALDSLRAERDNQLELIERLRAKLAQVHRDFNAAKAKIDEIQNAINAVEALVVDDDAAPETTSDYVFKALIEAGRPMRDDQLLTAIMDAGWVTDATDPLSTLRTLLGRMINREELIRVRPRWYELPGRAVESDSPNGQVSQPATGALLASDGEGG